MNRIFTVSLLILLLPLAACSNNSPDTSNEPEELSSSDTANEEGVSPRDGFAEAVAECLTEKGWDVTVNADHSIISEVPTDQQSQFEADHDECADSVGSVSELSITQEDAESIWFAMLDAAECVSGLNPDWAPDEPPSQQSAIEALQQSPIDLGGWSPHMNVPPEEQEYSNTECPAPAI